MVYPFLLCFILLIYFKCQPNKYFQALILKQNNQNDELPGFENSEQIAEDGEEFDKKPKKSGSKKGGGFQAMGLSYPVLKGIIKRGYKIPTPIQRKVFH